MNPLNKYLTLAASLAAFSVTAHAVPTLVLTDFDSGLTKTIVDGSLDDSITGLNNNVGFTGNLGEWTLNFTAGIVYGTDEQPIIHLSSLNMSNGFGGTSKLSVFFYADGFGPSIGSVNTEVGGATAGSINYGAWQDNANGMYPNFTFSNQIIGWNGSFGPGAFANSDSGALVLPASSYSLALGVQIEHGAGTQSSSVDYVLSVPDGGMTALLLGFGLLGVAAAARRIKI